ncbi:MAG: porin family protein [Candidatus Eisenbacteria bacterium]|uniref:Porin family protein n=1 Tax=Eiseniibacteriota bacterium TaxID=2212470 RepID=A0A849SFW8_UNCEI|nr:porin family protein [Candidatus Eisenbacteria bacterium]
MKFKSLILATAIMVCSVGAANAAGSFWLGANAGGAIPSGDFGDAAATGWNLGAVGTYMVNDQWGFGGDVGYHAWNGSEDLNASFGPNAEVKLSAIQATGHAVMLIPSNSNMKPYAKAGVGLYNLKGTSSGGTSTLDSSESKLGFNFGGGMNFISSGNMMWGLNGAYHMVPVDDPGADVNEFTLGVNLMWGMNGK